MYRGQRRASLIAAATGFALALTPGTAGAKEITGATICGRDGCRAVTDERLWPLLAEAGAAALAPTGKFARFVTRIHVDADGERVSFKMIVLPDRGLIQSEDGSWVTMTPAGRRAYVSLTNGRDPLAAAQLSAGDPPAEARVDEVFAPVAAEPVDASAPWPWLAGGGALLAAVVAASAMLLRRRTGAGRRSVMISSRST